MSYLQDRKRKKRKQTTLMLVALGIFIFLFFSSFIFSKLSWSFGRMFTSVMGLSARIGNNIGHFGETLASKNSLVEENQELKRQLLLIDTRVANYEAIFNENEKLKEILLRKPNNKPMVLAGIISNPKQSPYDTIIIDAGSNEGISSGMHVFAYGDVPIGTITEVLPGTSKVKLFSTFGEKTAAVISGSDTFIELIGRGRGNFEAVLPRDFELPEGTLALLPGVNPHTIAEVSTIISDPRDPFKKALLRTPINILELKFVEVAI